MRKRYNTLIRIFAVLLGLGLGQSAVALSPDQSEIGTDEEIAYTSGGVGLDEREALEAMSEDYNLKLIFALTTGHYLNGVEVRITDNGGRTVLEATSQGPWFFVRLPAGTYRVSARTQEQSQEKVTRVSAAGQARLAFSFQG
ncbi:MAG: carboxypeptidase regulatory-like domain-containing protein [Candidatus Binatia bacterium]